VNDTSLFLRHSTEPWATVLFRVLWLVLFMFLFWTGFTLYKLGCACLELYRLGYVVDFVPGAVLIVIGMCFGLWALCMLAKVAFWRLRLFEISRRDGMSAR
jgi:MFS superfamily sulfate permease-like transporter